MAAVENGFGAGRQPQGKSLARRRLAMPWRFAWGTVRRSLRGIVVMLVLLETGVAYLIAATSDEVFVAYVLPTPLRDWRGTGDWYSSEAEIQAQGERGEGFASGESLRISDKAVRGFAIHGTGFQLRCCTSRQSMAERRTSLLT